MPPAKIAVPRGALIIPEKLSKSSDKHFRSAGSKRTRSRSPSRFNGENRDRKPRTRSRERSRGRKVEYTDGAQSRFNYRSRSRSPDTTRSNTSSSNRDTYRPERSSNSYYRNNNYSQKQGNPSRNKNHDAADFSNSVNLNINLDMNINKQSHYYYFLLFYLSDNRLTSINLGTLTKENVDNAMTALQRVYSYYSNEYKNRTRLIRVDEPRWS